MELRYPEKECSYHPAGHCYLQIIGNVWRCKYCWAPKWQPKDYSEAVTCSMDIATLGLQSAYAKWLRYRPMAKEMLMKLEEIRLLREMMPKKELIRMVAAIMRERSK